MFAVNNRPKIAGRLLLLRGLFSSALLDWGATIFSATHLVIEAHLRHARLDIPIAAV